MHRGVAPGDQPIEIGTLPPEIRTHPDAELGQDTLERADGDPVEPAALDARDRRLREIHERGQVRLPDPPANRTTRIDRPTFA